MEPAVEERLTLAEYNKLEEESDTRYEYHQGEVFAMAGGDPKHSAIANSMGRLLGNVLLSKNCTVFNSDLKYRIDSLDKSLYPDVSVVCGTPERSKNDTNALTNPVLLVEVLSKSTASYDRGNKFHYYSQLSSLREYVLVEQDAWKVETRYRNAPDQPWKMDWFEGEAAVALRSLNITLPMAELYRGTEAL